MRKRRKTCAFRPTTVDTLENRTVLSGYGGFGGMGMLGGFGGMGGGRGMGSGMAVEMAPGSTGGGGFVGGGGGGGGGGGSAASQATQSVGNDFQTFQNAFELAIYNDLDAPATPNASGFSSDSTVSQAFTTLSTNLGNDVSAMAAANPNLATTLQTDVSTLQTTLKNLTPPSTTTAVPTFQQLALSDINQTYSQAMQQVSSAAPPAGTVTQQSLSTIDSQIATALQTFNSAVSSAAQAAVPVATSSTSSTTSTSTPSTSSTSFATAVQTAATALTTSVTGAVTASTSGLPSALATSLSTTLTNDVNTLQSSLTSLTVPTSSAGYGSWSFNSQVSSALDYGEGRLVQDLHTAVQTNNAALNPVTSTSTTSTATGTTITASGTTATPASTAKTTRLGMASLRHAATLDRVPPDTLPERRGPPSATLTHARPHPPPPTQQENRAAARHVRDS